VGVSLVAASREHVSQFTWGWCPCVCIGIMWGAGPIGYTVCKEVGCGCLRVCWPGGSRQRACITVYLLLLLDSGIGKRRCHRRCLQRLHNQRVSGSEGDRRWG
jgi:hypothetical protein